MFKMRWLVLGLLAALGAGFAAGARADDKALPPEGGDQMLAMGGPVDDGGPGAPGVEADEHGPGMGDPHGGPLQGLNLTQEQKDKLKALRRARREKVQALQNSLQDAREDLRDLLQGGAKGEDFNAKARAQNEKVLDLTKKLGQERFESILEIRSILTPDQLKKFGRFHPGPWRKGLRGHRGQGPAAQAGPGADEES